jgi:hypothetical protein
MVSRGEPLIVARGLCGRLELYGDRIRIVRRGLINYLLYLMGGTIAELDTHIPIDKIASIDIIKPIIWNDYVTFAYPGGPPNKGDTLKDATAENALFLNFFDNRAVYDIVYIVERMVSEPIHVTLESDQSRAAQRIRDRVSQIAGRERGGAAEEEATP